MSPAMEFTKQDLKDLQNRGKTPEQVKDELETIKNGIPFLEVAFPATYAHGLFMLSAELEERAIALWKKYLLQSHKIVKMVPASGAASRMFKDLLAFLNGKDDKPRKETVKEFFENLFRFSFYRRLNLNCLTVYHKNICELKKDGRYKDVLHMLLDIQGMNYRNLPKALLSFHKVPGTNRTPLEEHLAEAAQYATGHDGIARVHFTVSPEHLALFDAKVHEIKNLMELEYGVKFEVSFSVQDPSTDTIAANLDGTPFRVDGELLFRPGGHGALIKNLNEIDADIIFIKNIDNVVPDTKRDESNRYKAVMAGVLVGVKQMLDRYMELLEKGKPTDDQLKEMVDFIHTTLHITGEKAEEMDRSLLIDYLKSKFNRPLRVCGMVRNTGEPGGGPFMVYNPLDHTISPQILELSQIDTSDPHMVDMLKKATHFNPVDIVCSVRDYKGKKYNLTRFVDHLAGFISQKSKDGRDLIALELPGLWNGAMSDWNTIFVEIPGSSFNPVKIVNDLLRPAHLYHS